MSVRRGEDRSKDMIGVESEERRGEDWREYEWIDQRGRQGAMNRRKQGGGRRSGQSAQ